MRQLAVKNGWIEPVYWGRDDDGRPVAAFSDEDYERIRQGYGCPNCWQAFSIVMVKCPVCQLDLASNLDPHMANLPDGWAPSPDDDLKMKSRKGG